MELSNVTAYERFNDLTPALTGRDVCHPVIEGHVVSKNSHLYQPSVHAHGTLVLTDDTFSNGGDIEDGGTVIVETGARCNNIYVAGGTLVVDGGKVSQIMLDVGAKLIVKAGEASFVFASEFSEIKVVGGSLIETRIYGDGKLEHTGGILKNVEGGTRI